MTSRLIVSGQYDRQNVYTESEAKDVYWHPHHKKMMHTGIQICISSPWCCGAPQHQGPSSPAYGSPPTANRWLPFRGSLTPLQGDTAGIFYPPAGKGQLEVREMKFSTHNVCYKI